MTHITEEDLVLLYYNEPGVPKEVRRHLRECGACTAAARQLARELASGMNGPFLKRTPNWDAVCGRLLRHVWWKRAPIASDG